jgi:muramoyltetrapeptide carboxypeptidase
MHVLFAQKSNMKTPRYLKKGDTIAILAPAGVIKDNAAIYAAKYLAESWGLHVIFGAAVFNKNGHFAGKDSERLHDFQWALDNRAVKAIWCARGGYGSVRLIDDLDFSTFLQNPKWIIGYSDITVFHNHLHNLGVQTLHAMMPVNMEFSEESRKESVFSLQKALFGENIAYESPSSKNNLKGKAKGTLVGGNLTLLENLIGTPSEIKTEGKLLFIEEIGEYKYQLDRLLRALDRSGFFKNCEGLLVGDFSKIKTNNPAYTESLETIILEIVAKYNFPVAFHFPAGHEPKNWALVLGNNVELIVAEETATLRFLK